MNGPDYSALLATVNLEALVAALVAVGSIYIACLIAVKSVKLLIALVMYERETERLWRQWNSAGPSRRIWMSEHGLDPRQR